MPRRHYIVDLTRIARADGRYVPEAYKFVLDGLDYELKRLSRRRHLSGQELAEALRKLALRRFGMLARSVLESWGVRTTGDFGEIVYVLIRHGILRRRREDSKDDFKNVYDFHEAFDDAYQIAGRGRHICLELNSFF